MRIQKDMFEAETEDTSSIQSLMTAWTTDGITSVSGLCCKTCPSVKKADPHNIIEKSRLSVDNGGPPQHLYMLVHAALIIDESGQQSFMASLDFPFKLDFHGVGYTLFSRGFWNSTHYWTKMFKDIGGISGVWMHDDQANGGIARLVSPDHTQLAGAAPHTSWVFYSRPWTSSEEKFVAESIASIRRDNKNAQGLVPFAHLRMILNLSGKSIQIPTIEDTLTMEETPTMAASNLERALGQTPRAICTTSVGIQPNDLKRKPSGEFKVCLKIMKGPETSPVAKIEDEEPPVPPTSKEVMPPKKKLDSIPKSKIIKPFRAGSRASTRKSASQG
ncbi:uncharacterized protein PGTG_13761 [Puccinia graminis f. sp. tritici CRL 75-36-700-3]|uniref:Uncharacterized protein n=1 Tax=Puccinia graminis f. sp. tritici (strain CRL 75-36-700-3 / race SCCL) TaxID=418459 RepID=E3KUK7_PUCGT|nr:uncharacterized protein PGTG_13761 [Puccinia graminis f. sp. tritici CRL 75-36-700-3]EFP87957.2 hypothetical protein PGTG_13761 [Puccinia graminis f. sp. tritici CRL 75-36-700-3]